MRSDEDREHVTSFIYQKIGNTRLFSITNTKYTSMAGVQLAIDTQKDLDNARKILSACNNSISNISLKELADYYSRIKMES